MTYFALVRGRGADRVSLSLGYVSEEEADCALETIRREEADTAGTPLYDRVFVLWKDGDDEVRAQVVRRLVSADREALDEAFGRAPVRHDRMALRDYWETVFWSDVVPITAERAPVEKSPPRAGLAATSAARATRRGQDRGTTRTAGPLRYSFLKTLNVNPPLFGPRRTSTSPSRSTSPVVMFG